MSESTAICVECFDKILERALSLEQTCSGYRKEPSGQEFSFG
jgi:hypothetical protein